jgi:type II secretory pathway pseudopilin PulG
MSRVTNIGRHFARGVTLIELVMFIVIVGIVAVAMVQAFSGTMRGSGYGKQLTQATQLAQQRMEVILARRKALGYAGFDATTFDPCDGVGPVWVAQVCQTTVYAAGSFVVTSTFNSASDACGAGSGTNCREVTVSVASPYGDTVARLTAQVWNY